MTYSRKPVKRVRKIADLIPKESAEQIRFVTWLTRNNILFFSVPNGARTSALQAIKLKREGMQGGVPDIIVPMASPDKRYHGLAIELKRTVNGQLSEKQAYWLEALRAQGWKSEMCKGADAAIAVCKEYFSVI